MWTWISDNLAPGDIITALAVIVSAAVAIRGWGKTHALNRELQRKQLALQLCNPHNNTDTFWHSLGLVLGPPGDLEIPPFEQLIAHKGLKGEQMEATDWEMLQAVNDVLNYFEYVAVAVLSEAAHEEFVKHWFGPLILGVYPRLEAWIKEVRRLDKSNDPHASYEQLVKRWTPPDKPVPNLND